LNAFNFAGRIPFKRMGGEMKLESASHRGATDGRHVCAAVVAWASVIAVCPWIPLIAGVADLSGVTVFLSMMAGGITPSLLLGLLLGHTRTWEVLGACAAAGMFLWAVDVALFGDSDAHIPQGASVAIFVPMALILIVAPLLAGALAGRSCPRFCRGH
jgi:hypothetical protein